MKKQEVSMTVKDRTACESLAGALAMAGFRVEVIESNYYSGDAQRWINDGYTLKFSGDGIYVLNP